MLFDLQSPGRRRFIKVIYAGLAVLMGGGLILFGIGGGGGGGLLDAVGLTDSSGSGSSSAGFDDQINEAEAKVAANPKDPAAQLELVRAHFLAGNAALDSDPDTGQAVATDDSIQQFQRAADAWDQYLKLNSKQPSPEVASLMVQAFVGLAEAATTAGDAQTSIEDAAATQQIVADNMPSQGAYANLALYLYFSGDVAGGDEAASNAEAQAQPSQRAAVKTQIESLKKRAAAFQKQVKDAAKQAASQGSGAAPGTPGAASPLDNPLGGAGGLSGGSSLSTP